MSFPDIPCSIKYCAWLRWERFRPGENGGAGGGCGSGGCGPADDGCQSGGVGAEPSPCAPAPGPSQTLCCLAAGESVPLHGGGCKLAGEIRQGDIILSLDALRAKSPERVIATFGGLQPVLRVIHEKGEFVCSESHLLVLASDAVRAAGELKEGDILRAFEGESRIEAVYPAGEAQVYGWTCEPSHTYFAAGVLNHNKATTDAGVYTQ